MVPLSALALPNAGVLSVLAAQARKAIERLKQVLHRDMRRHYLIVLFVLCWLRPAHGGIRPSFMLDYSSWHSTDIALVAATAADGNFEVIEAWKGNLRSGDRITVPDLIPATNAVPIGLYPDESLSRENRVRTQVPKQFVGMRLVLFLKRSSSPHGSQPQWQASNLVSDMKASVVWLDGSRLFRFTQTTSPGPSSLEPWEMGFAKLRERVSEVLQVQREFRDVVGTEDGAQRASALKPYLLSDILPARMFAEEELGKCGPTAVRMIDTMLDDEAFAMESGALVRALVRAGAASVGSDLTTRLRHDLDFWQGVGPRLRQDWWNNDPTPKSPLRNRYSQTLELIRGLDAIRFVGAMSTVTAMRDYWRSMPQLDDPSGLNQLSEACDEFVNHSQ